MRDTTVAAFHKAEASRIDGEDVGGVQSGNGEDPGGAEESRGGGRRGRKGRCHAMSRATVPLFWCSLLV